MTGLPLGGTTTINQVSRPVLADLNGDGSGEIVVLTATSGLALIRWIPGAMPPVRNRVSLAPALSPYNGGTPVTNGPIVVPVRVRSSVQDALIVAGYPGGIAVVAGNPPQVRLMHVEPRIPAMSAAASIVEQSDTTRVVVATLYGDRSMTFTTLQSSNGAWTVVDSYTHETPMDVELAVTRDVRIAFGDIDGNDGPEAVIVHNGLAIIYPLDRNATPFVLDVWKGSIDGVQYALLANVDGKPGAEIIAFDPRSPFLHGIDREGRTLDGWDPSVQALDGGQLRVLVTDLDPRTSGSAVGDLEIVTLSNQRLEVLVLGPGSYDLRATPWPQSYRDSRATSAHGPSEQDPRLPGAGPTMP
jgi:hypothetical protein